MSHYRTISKLSIACAAAFIGTFTPTAEADLMEIIFTGQGRGTLDGQVFAVSNFTVTALGNTNDREQPHAHVWILPHQTASITINGLGTFAVLSPTHTFVNQLGPIVGFSRSPGADLLSGWTNPIFADWELNTSVGPIGGSAGTFQWNLEPLIETTGGVLIFESQSFNGTFSATIVPAPGAFMLLAVAGGIGGARRRRRSA